MPSALTLFWRFVHQQERRRVRRRLYADADGDGHGDAEPPTTDCDALDGFTSRRRLRRRELRRVPTKTCDGLDNNCDGAPDLRMRARHLAGLSP